MKIEFDYFNVDERKEIEQWFRIGQYLSALEEIHQMARSQLKHGEALGEKADEMLEDIKRISSVVFEE